MLLPQLKTKTAKALSDAGKQQIAVFSPDGNQVAFLRANNLFIKDLNSDILVSIGVFLSITLSDTVVIVSIKPLEIMVNKVYHIFLNLM